VAGVVQGSFLDAMFVGPSRDGRCTLHLTLRSIMQVGQLFRAREQLQKEGVASRVDQQRSAAQLAPRNLLLSSPSFKAAVHEEVARRSPAAPPAARRGAFSNAGRVLWLPHGCVVGDGFWTATYAACVDEFKAHAAAGAAGGRDAAFTAGCASIGTSNGAGGGARAGGDAGASGSGSSAPAAAAAGAGASA
jgi:hypothetical protein